MVARKCPAVQFTLDISETQACTHARTHTHSWPCRVLDMDATTEVPENTFKRPLLLDAFRTKEQCCSSATASLTALTCYTSPVLCVSALMCSFTTRTKAGTTARLTAQQHISTNVTLHTSRATGRSSSQASCVVAFTM